MDIHKRYKRKDCAIGPLGFPQRDQAARVLEAQLKEAEKNGIGYKRAFIANKPTELQEGERADISIITSNVVDRDNEVVLASGADLKQFEANPVITWGHDYSKAPIGRAVWVKFEPTRSKAQYIKAKIEYAPQDSNPLADTAWQLVKAGFLKGKSIGFLPMEISPPSQKEIDKQPDLEGVRNVIRKWSLFEVAVATVPANPTALVESVAKGELILPDYLIEEMGLTMPQEDVVEFKLWDWDEQPEPQTKETLPQPKVTRRWRDVESKVLQSLTTENELMRKITGK